MSDIKNFLANAAVVLFASAVTFGAMTAYDNGQKNTKKDAIFNAMPAVYAIDSAYFSRRDSLNHRIDSLKNAYHLQLDSLDRSHETQIDSLRNKYEGYLENRVGGK